MLGSLTPLSRFQLPPHLTNQPTRAEVNWINDFFSIKLLTTDWPWPLGACGVKPWSLHTGTLRSRLPLPQVVFKSSLFKPFFLPSQSWRYKEGMSGSYAQWVKAQEFKFQSGKVLRKPYDCLMIGTSPVAGLLALGLDTMLVSTTIPYRCVIVWYIICA